MLNLTVWRSRAESLADLLDYAAVIEDGIISTKSGALLAAWRYEGTDLTSASDAEKNVISEHVNNSLAILGNGWMTHHDAIRVPVEAYFAKQDWPDPVSELIDEERREHFEGNGTHYETLQLLTVSYLPPITSSSRVGQWIYGEAADRKTIADRELERFQQVIAELEGRLGAYYRLQRLRARTRVAATGRERVQDEFLSYLQWVITGIRQPIQLPPCPMYLDAVIGCQDFVGGVAPQVGEQHIRVVALDGLPQESYPEILAGLDTLPMAYRWSSRFIYMDGFEAENALERFRKKWEQKKRPIRDQIFGTNSGKVDLDAVAMEADATSAKADAVSGQVRYGYYSSVIVILDPDPGRADEVAAEIATAIRNVGGFSARIERENAIEAWLGSLPGNGWANVRRPVLHTLNLVDLLPLSTIWPGEKTNPCPFYPPHSPPLMMAGTEGSTPFRLNVHVGDVGHTFCIGPTGSGKSTLLNLMAAQARRYPKATVVIFDKKRSAYATTLAVGGAHYDIAGDHGQVTFAPLAQLETERDRMWAAGWLEMVVRLNGADMNVTRRRAIADAVRLMADSAHRTLTDFVATVQDPELRTALEPYLVGGEFGTLFDAERDTIRAGDWMCFELDELMGLGQRAVLPALLYLFNRIERRMQGQPGFLFIDEAWSSLAHEVFRDKLTQWLKELRKSNWAVLLFTQSIGDAARTGMLEIINESCQTKLFLANPAATEEEPARVYQALGVTQAQRQIIKRLEPKREYYLSSPMGQRRFRLDLGPIALSFAGISAPEEVAQIHTLQEKHGERWPFAWLQLRGVLPNTQEASKW